MIFNYLVSYQSCLNDLNLFLNIIRFYPLHPSNPRSILFEKCDIIFKPLLNVPYLNVIQSNFCNAIILSIPLQMIFGYADLQFGALYLMQSHRVANYL